MKRYACGLMAFLATAVLVCGGCAASEIGSDKTLREEENQAGGYTSLYSANMNKDKFSGSVAEDTADSGTGEDTRKRVKTVQLSLETEAFDSLMTCLSEEVSSRGGYVQSHQAQGSGQYRTATLTVRVPAKETEAFLSTVGTLGRVYSRHETEQDVTLEYVDTESRIQALKTEQETLLRLLEEAESLEDVLAVQDRLTEVRYELESHAAALRVLENQVAYASLTLYIREVERESAAAEEGTWATVGTNISNNFYAIGVWLENAAVWLISSIPYLLIALVPLAVAAAILWRRFRKKKKEEK